MMLTPLINVEDASRSIKFYTENFGFEVEHQFEVDGKVTWARVRPLKRYDDVVLYFEVDGAQEVHDEMLRKGFSPGHVERQEYGVENSLCVIPMATNWYLRVDSSDER